MEGSGIGAHFEQGFITYADHSEAALFEAVQPVVDCLAVPAVFGFNIGSRESFEIFACGGEPV